MDERKEESQKWMSSKEERRKNVSTLRRQRSVS